MPIINELREMFGIEYDSTYNYNYFYQLYLGDIQGFHNYTSYVNGKEQNCKRESLHFGKTVCEYMANLINSANVEFNFDNIDDKETFLYELKENKFIENYQNFLETVFAIGSGVITTLPSEFGVDISFIPGNQMLIQSTNGKRVNGVVIFSQDIVNTIVDGKPKEYYLTFVQNIKRLDRKTTSVENYLFKSEDENYLGDLLDASELKKRKGVDPSGTIVSEKDLFYIYTVQSISNPSNSLLRHPSILSIIDDELKNLDIAYDNMINEINVSRKRMFIADTLMTTTPNSPACANGGVQEGVKYFDPNNEYYQLFVGDDERANNLLQVVDTDIRIKEYKNTIDTIIRLIANKLNIDGDELSVNISSTPRTATEVVMLRNKTFTTKERYNKVFRRNLVSIFETISMLLGVSTPEIEFDYTEIETTNERNARLYNEVVGNIISKKQYLREVYNYSNEKIDEIFRELNTQVRVENHIFNNSEKKENENIMNDFKSQAIEQNKNIVSGKSESVDIDTNIPQEATISGENNSLKGGIL